MITYLPLVSSHEIRFVDEMDSIDNGEILGGSGATLLCISESLMGGMGADERVLFGVVSICLSTAEIIYDEFIDTGMRPELEVKVISQYKPAPDISFRLDWLI